MRIIKSFIGTPIPVSDAFVEAHLTPHPGIERASFGDLKSAQQRLLDLSSKRQEGQRFGLYPTNMPLLNNVERAALMACDALLNVNATERTLAGRDPKVDYGEDVPFDALKFTDWAPDTCGCRHRFMWRKDHDGEERRHFSHYVLQHCNAHAHLTSHVEHFAEILAENRHGNAAREVVAAHLGVAQEVIAKSYNEFRELVLTHPALTSDKHPVVSSKLAASKHANRRETHLSTGE